MFSTKKRYQNSSGWFGCRLFLSWNRHFLWIVPLGLSMLLLYHNPSLISWIPSKLVEHIQPQQVKRMHQIQRVLSEMQAMGSTQSQSYKISDLNHWMNQNPNLWLYYHQMKHNLVNLVPFKYQNPLFQLHQIQLTSMQKQPSSRLLLPVHYIVSKLVQGTLENPSQSQTSFPKDTKLLNYHIKNSILTLNFNHAFLKTSNGHLGKKLQLMQLISSFLHWPFVEGIRIQIDGKTPSYLDQYGVIENKIFYKTDLVSSFPIDN